MGFLMSPEHRKVASSHSGQRMQPDNRHHENATKSRRISKVGMAHARNKRPVESPPRRKTVDVVAIAQSADARAAGAGGPD